METFLVVSSVLLWVVVGFNLLLTLALVRKMNAGGQAGRLKPGTKAPDFSAQTLQGETVTLVNYARKKVAFLFISPHCSPCRESMPKYQEWYPKAKQAGVEIVLVSIGEIEETQAFAEEFKLNQPIIVAPQGNSSFMQDYQATGTPSYCLVDEKGKVVSAGYPSMEWGEWKKLSEKWESAPA